MRLAQYDFHAVFEENAVLPKFKGSTFRGAFGWALKRVACPMGERDCRICLVRSRCIYPTVFEPTTNDAHGLAPHPYAIIPPTTRERAFRKGESFDFSLILFGSATEYLPYFIAAFERMGQSGIGRGEVRPRARFALQAVSYRGQRIYDARSPHVLQGTAPDELDLAQIPPVPARAVEVRWRTPVRLKADNHLAGKLPFDVLIRGALRRVSSLFHAFGAGEPPLDYRGLAKRAASITTARDELEWIDHRRFSSRQEREMLLGGLTGRILYRGDLTEFTPLLTAAEVLRIGKQTTFGLGWMEYRVIE